MPNRLARETSPYLRQHADNPVDWHPWGPEALARARAEQKPIFLSIGYSTCHWCHVMAHESFEDPSIAGLLNGHFVPIKVDREERPDLDRVYMAYVQALTGRGGWPLSAWLTPELKPFFGGTYFPAEDREGRAGFASILQAIIRAWREERAAMLARGESAIAALSPISAAARTVPFRNGREEGEESLADAAGRAFEECFHDLRRSFDSDRGGFGGAPKFPQAGNLNFLFRCASFLGRRSEAGREAADMAARTLRAMASGGIHDHVGGGFHRYSVDEDWFVPHFEKMLCDQAQIAVSALEAWQATGDEIHAGLARDIVEYVLRDLAHPAGGFFAAEDADSEASAGGRKTEGAFYLWTQAGIDAALSPADAALFRAHYGVNPEGNVPADRDPFGEFGGRNILACGRPLADTAREFGLGPEAAEGRLRACLERLRGERAKRPRPQRDEKVVAAWNGLMISALARASSSPAAAFADFRDSCRRAAVRAAEFVRRELFNEAGGALFRSWCGRRGGVEGFAEDYAFVVQGLLDLYEATFEVRWLQWAERLQEGMDGRFWDGEAGGYFNSAAGAPDIVLRLKEDHDGAEPAPNSVAAMNLSRLAAIFDRPGGASPSCRDRMLGILGAFRPRWRHTPLAVPQMLCALERAVEAPLHVVLAGDPAAADFQALADVLAAAPGPRRSVLAADGGPGQEWLADRAPWIAGMRPLHGRATAFVCENFTCQAPVTAPEQLRELLETS